MINRYILNCLDIHFYKSVDHQSKINILKSQVNKFDIS